MDKETLETRVYFIITKVRKKEHNRLGVQRRMSLKTINIKIGKSVIEIYAVNDDDTISNKDKFCLKTVHVINSIDDIRKVVMDIGRRFFLIEELGECGKLTLSELIEEVSQLTRNKV